VLHEVVHELKFQKHGGTIIKLDFKKTYDRVHWDFMREVLEQKDFPSKWIQWVMQSLEVGRVSINVNNEQGGIF
jgi:hypothetical protein